MNNFKSPFASETLKEVMLRTFPELNIHIDEVSKEKIARSYDEHKLYEVFVEVLKAEKDKKDIHQINKIINNLID